MKTTNTNTTKTNALYVNYMKDNHPELLAGIPSDIIEKCTAKWNKKGNTKVGSMWTFSTLYGNISHYIPAFNIEMEGTCGNHCDGCIGACYVASSYRYPSVKQGHANNTIAIRKDIQAAEDALNGYIDRARKKPSVCRFDQSGEIESIDELIMFCNIARKHPDIEFYVYTKCYNYVIPALLAGAVPSNLTVLISVWHKIGIKEYLKVSHLDNVRAFVVVDNVWTREKYAEHGLNIETMCMAYDERGKMNHDISCNKCGKCFSAAVKFKVIGCFEH